jgi:hypothetical protein
MLDSTVSILFFMFCVCVPIFNDLIFVLIGNHHRWCTTQMVHWSGRGDYP